MNYPKIFALGTVYIKDIFEDEVELTEKIDGSMFGFGKTNGILHMHSKGAQLYLSDPNRMFKKAVDYITSIQDRIPDNMMFFGEYLQGPKHNTLKYDRVPKNNIALFGAASVTQEFYPDINKWAELFEIDRAPILYTGKVNSVDMLYSFLERDSYLGGTKIEGVVVKNYHRAFLLGGQPIPLMAGKLVSEKFKEVHNSRWGKEETTKGKMEVFMDSFCTEARWLKAIQHLREAGTLLGEPKDIGPLMKSIHLDIEQEEEENVKEFLWNEYKGDIKRRAVRGLPEWYKRRLIEGS